MQIHLGRHEYRNEYLRCAHWTDFRSKIVAKFPRCQKCKERPSLHVHHCNYYRLYRERESDVLALCPPCHKLIEMAKSFKLISQNHDQFAARSVNRKQIDALRKSVGTLSLEQAMKIQHASLYIQRRIVGYLKLPSFPSDWRNIVGTKLTARKFWFIQMSLSGKLSGAPLRKKSKTLLKIVKIHY